MPDFIFPKSKIIFFYAAAAFVIAFICLGIFEYVFMSKQGENSTQVYYSKPVKISFATWGNPNEREIQRLVAREFSKKNNAIVDVFCFSDRDSCMSKVITQFAAGDPFDTFYTDEKTFLILAQKDWLLDLTQLETDGKIKAGDYYEIAFKKGLFDKNKLLGLPTGINPTLIYYNQKMFEEAGISSPDDYYNSGKWNQEKFIYVCKKIKEAKKAYGITIKNDWPTTFSIIYNNGGKILDFLKDGSIVADEKALESIHYIKELIDCNVCIYMGSLSKGVTEEELFKSGQVAMVYGGYEYATSFKDIKDFSWDVVPFPSNGMGCKISALNVPIISAAKNTREKDMVQKFILFYVGGQGQKLRLEKGEKNLPSLKYTVYLSSTDVMLPAHSNYYFYSLNEGFIEEYSLNYLEIRNKIYSMLNDLWSGQKDTDSVIKTQN